MQMSTPKRHEHHLGFALLQSKHLLLSVLVRRRGKRTSLSRSSIFSPARRAAPCARVVTTYLRVWFRGTRKPSSSAPPSTLGGRGERAERRKFRPHLELFYRRSPWSLSTTKKKMNRARSARGEETSRGGKDRRAKQSPRRCRPSVRVR